MITSCIQIDEVSTHSPRSASQSKNEEIMHSDVEEEEEKSVELQDESLGIQDEELLVSDSWKSLEELKADQMVVN